MWPGANRQAKGLWICSDSANRYILEKKIFSSHFSAYIHSLHKSPGASNNIADHVSDFIIW